MHRFTAPFSRLSDLFSFLDDWKQTSPKCLTFSGLHAEMRLCFRTAASAGGTDQLKHQARLFRGAFWLLAVGGMKCMEESGSTRPLDGAFVVGSKLRGQVTQW